MTKKFNKGSKNQNSPRTSGGNGAVVSGDNSKSNKRNKSQNDKTDSD